MSSNSRWRDYERGLLERLRYEFDSKEFRVEGTVDGRQHRIRGRHSGSLRQLDAAVYRLGDPVPFFVADAKLHHDALDVTDVDAFVGLLDDVGATCGLLAAPDKPSTGAIRRATAVDITVWVLSLDEALTGRWLPLAKQLYRWDRIFHEHLALALRALDESSDAGRICCHRSEWNPVPTKHRGPGDRRLDDRKLVGFDADGRGSRFCGGVK